MDARSLIQQTGALFEKRAPILSLWQTIAENFHVVRADFTRNRNLGEEFASNLLSSYPLIAHRELSNVMSSMLRRDEWFKLGKSGTDAPGNQAQRWMDNATRIQRGAMYRRGAMFTKATKEGDGDFAAFGQAVLSVEMNKDRSGLLFRSWHLRDVAWAEDETGQVAQVARKWRPAAIDLVRMFPKAVSPKTKEIADKTPYAPIECLHVLSPADMINSTEFGDAPYVSSYIEVAEQAMLEQVGLYNKMYCIPRWQTVSGSQYAYSPATVAALPDSRLLQAMTMTLLEAGEKFTNPPMIAMEGMLRSDLQVFAGGVTWVDADYDERLGEVLRPMSQNSGGMPLGFNMAEDIRNQIAESFFLNKLTLPDARQMTAYEVSERMNEFVRQTLPLFEPMEQEYNGQLCEIVFELMMRNGEFGSPLDIPLELRGESVEFQFETPISQAIGKKKGQTFQQTAELLAIAAQMDPGARHQVDVNEALRDALTGIGVPADWRRPEEQVEQMRIAEQMQQMAAMAAQGVEE